MKELSSSTPACQAPLDPGFQPAVLSLRSFAAMVEEAGGGEPLVLALERPDGSLTRFETAVLPDDHPLAESNLHQVERIFKMLLWQRGGSTVYVGGSTGIAEHLAMTYASGGAREFDAGFMGREVYDRQFKVVACTASEVPAAKETGRQLGRHLDGCRIGFDLGASDRKVAAVVDGEVRFSEEVVWAPGTASDPEYHYQEIMVALNRAAAEMPRVDAIGGSSAGIVVDNQIRVASLFRSVPPERYSEVRDLFQRIHRELGVPLEIVNDGEVTALAGSMALGKNGVLGIAMGSSLAAGYIGLDGNVTTWLNELAFAPIDYNPDAPRDEWSGDRGCGVQYLSQQCVFRLASQAGIELAGDTPAAKLAGVQEQLEAGHPGARRIWESIGVYLGYAIAHYATFYDIKQLLMLGRCTSGSGGWLILEGARQVLRREFPELADSISLQLPDEKSRRVGQSIAAASLPQLEAHQVEQES
jgi:predicted NBD/HSP70 family sugar kinase